MKQIILSLILIFIYSNAFSQNNTDPGLKTEIDSVSYAVGYSMGQNMVVQGLEINLEVFVNALESALNRTESVLTDDEMTQIIVSFQQKQMKERDKKLKVIGDKNKKEGDSFLAKNKKMPGVVTTPSGLQYKILDYGDGASPKREDKVKVNYEGRLIDGRIFDSSYKRGKPIEFELLNVIPGWTEALQLMHVGDKWELYIPSELAYGNQQRSELIGPNTTLIFTVELLDIVK